MSCIPGREYSGRWFQDWSPEQECSQDLSMVKEVWSPSQFFRLPIYWKMKESWIKVERIGIYLEYLHWTKPCFFHSKVQQSHVCPPLIMLPANTGWTFVAVRPMPLEAKGTEKGQLDSWLYHWATASHLPWNLLVGVLLPDSSQLRQKIPLFPTSANRLLASCSWNHPSWHRPGSAPRPRPFTTQLARRAKVSLFNWKVNYRQKSVV